MKINEIRSPDFGLVLTRLAPMFLAETRRIGRCFVLSLGDDALWPQRTLSVSIEEGQLAVIHGARVFSRIGVTGTRQYLLEPGRYPQADAVAERVRLAAEELHASAQNITLMVPSEWVIARAVELPLAAAENLQAAVSFEMDRFTPLTAENALYDFLPLSKNEETIRLFLAVCRADIVTPYITALNAVSVSVGRITTRLTAAATASTFIANSGTLAFAEVRKNGYSGGVTIDGRICGLFGDVFNGEAPDAKVGKIKEEFSMAAAYLSEGNVLSEAVMVGDESISHETVKRSMASATILNDLDQARLHVKEPSAGLTLAQMGSIIEPLWPKAQGIDLLSKGERKKQPLPVALTVLLLVALAATVLIYAIAPLNIERRRIEEIERQIALLKEPVRKVDLLKKEVEAQEQENGAIEGFKSGRVRTMDILREVTIVLPKNAWLTRARITEKSVDLEGYAGSAAEVLPKLEASPLLAKVEFASPTFRDARQNADRFVIKMEIENEKKPDTGGSKNEAKK